MVKLISPSRLTKNSKVAMPVDVYFDYIDLNAIDKQQIYTVIRQIDGVDYLAEKNEITSKFDTSISISVDKLSTGCKAALLILYYSTPREEQINTVDISECGENAIDVCLELLNNSSLQGLIYASLRSTDNSKKWDILANDTRVEDVSSARIVLNKG